MSFLLIMMAAWGIASVCLRSFSFADALEATGMRLLAGMVPVACLALVVGSFSLIAAQVLLAIIAFTAVLIYWRASHTPAPIGLFFATPLSLLEKGSLAAILMAWGLTLFGALAPVTNWDACVAHLALPADYARIGHIFLHPGNVYSGYPHFMHALYAVAYYGGSDGHELPVSLLNWTMGVLACLALYSLGRRIATRQTGLVAAALLATAPIYMDQAGGVGIDLPFVAFSTAALAALVAWNDQRQWSWLILAAIFAGSACGIRHTGYVCAAFLAVAVLLRATPGQRMKYSAVFAGIAALAALPWLGRTWLLTSNPIFPFLLDYFPQSSIDHIAISAPGSHESIERSRGLTPLALLRFPWDIIMRPQDYDGWSKSPGGLVLILGVPGLLLGGARAWWLGAYSLSGGAVFFFFQRLARYLLPFFTPMMVVAALTAERLPRGRRAVIALLFFSFAYGLTLHAAAVHFKVGVVLGMQTKQDYLTERVERYGAFQYANAHLNDGGTLLTIDQRSYYIDGPTYQNHWSLIRIATESLVDQVAWLHETGIRYVMIPTDFVETSGALSGDIAVMLRQWRNAPEYFEALGAPLQLPRRNGGGLEEVAFYAVR
ncbi:MAG: glycosyltransferase family 39 protein [Candidatus Hydrogenedentes bacterium]|nr:glycosyltransferase family 39 protein [Candidatus Hydrogenedentota bacterium]